jgi:hypothetical protein
MAPGFRVTKVEFAREHPGNRAPGSRGKRYRGELFVNGTAWVYVADEKGICRDLDPRLDLANHSPDGVAWGYLGSGPAQLALALLADLLGDDQALAHYQRFKEAVLARWPQDQEWSASETVLRSLFDQVCRARNGAYRP